MRCDFYALCLFISLLFATLAARHISGTPMRISYRLEYCTKSEIAALPNVRVIRELSLQNCSIDGHLSNAYFMRYSSLLALQINNCDLRTIEDYALHGLLQLKKLSLARNRISVVKSWSNEPLQALNALDLRYNELQQLTERSFERYPNLQHLDLAHNQLEAVDASYFQACAQLKHLSLAHNRLKVIGENAFEDMHRLMYLSLSFNGITHIEPAALATNTHLRDLRLDGNQLRNLDFLNERLMARLTRLNLSHNALTELPANPKPFSSGGYELVDLDLSHNNLSQIAADDLLGLEMLENFNVSHNRLRLIEPECFKRLTSLIKLDLSTNQLRELDGQLLVSNVMLRALNLAENALTQIDVALLNRQPYLRHLNAAGNQLGATDFLLHLAPSLNRQDLSIDLSLNRLTTLNATQFAQFKHINLSGNLWQCAWLTQQLFRTPRTINFVRQWPMMSTRSGGDDEPQLQHANGIDCYDGQLNRTIILLDMSQALREQPKPLPVIIKCETPTTTDPNPSAPPLNWPKIRNTDKFDSRSVIIWMLIAIAVAFSALRIARQIIDQKERQRLLRRLREQKTQNSGEQQNGDYQLASNAIN